MESITKKAYGKINLSLDVTGRREDGYHLVRMIMQTVGIYDTLTICRQEEEGIRLFVDNSDIPAGEDNLAFRAAKVMQERYGIRDGLSIRLEKRIPVAAGMAGGSTDAAAVLRGLRDMFVPEVTDEELQKLALPMGADIPYCITGGTQLSEGIGEILTPLPKAPQCSLLVIKPDLFVSTGWVYKEFDGIPEEEVQHPDVDAMCEAIRKDDLNGMAKLCGNVLEQKTGAAYPVIGQIERFMEERGALKAMMTGSGPTVFGIFEDAEKAEAAYREALSRDDLSGFQTFLTEFV